MHLKNALRLTFTHNSLVIKSLLYRLLIYAVYFLCAYLLLNDILSVLFTESCFSDLFSSLWKHTKGFFKGEGFRSGMLDTQFTDCVKVIVNTCKANIGKIIAFVLFNFAFEIVNNFADSAIVNVVNNHMSYMSREGFFGSLVRNFKMALSYGIFFSLFKMLYSLVSLLIIILICVGLFKIIGFFALPFAIIVYVLAIALRQTIISQVLPYMAVNKCSIFKSVKSATFNGEFSGIYVSYILAYALTLYVNVTAILCTFGAGAVLTIPLTYMLIDVLGLTSFFEINKMKYYITYDLRYIPKELRDNDEHLLNQMSI